MTSPVRCTIQDGIAQITMDDGKSNVISPTMLDALNHALDQAEAANAVVVLSGREQIFSAGFDLQILKSGVVSAFRMLIGGFKLSRRLLAFPTPVVIACNGHAMAMGSFLLLSGDYRIGVEGPFKIVANEVAIGLTMPYAAVEICRQRLRPGHLDRCVTLSELHDPLSAIEAGFLDVTVSADALTDTALAQARAYTKLDLKAHHRSKLRLRHDTLKRLSRAIRQDIVDFILLGCSQVLGRKRR